MCDYFYQTSDIVIVCAFRYIFITCIIFHFVMLMYDFSNFQKANIVQRTRVKAQVESSRVDVPKTLSAKTPVGKRVLKLAFVILDLLLINVNVVSHACSRTPGRSRKHCLVVLACILLNYQPIVFKIISLCLL